MFGLLKSTKTSGPDKRLSVLPVYVSKEAYVDTPWLEIGFGIWNAEPFNFRRDYFLCLPNVDMSGVVKKRARYSDASGFSRSLFASLPLSVAQGEGEEDQEMLLCPEASDFWTEHSDRAGLDSWLATLQVPADFRKFVGGWAVQGTEDVYVRTAVRVVENLQRFAALHARMFYNTRPDFLGEEHLLEQL